MLHPIEEAATTRNQLLCGCQQETIKLAAALHNKIKKGGKRRRTPTVKTSLQSSMKRRQFSNPNRENTSQCHRQGDSTKYTKKRSVFILVLKQMVIVEVVQFLSSFSLLVSKHSPSLHAFFLLDGEFQPKLIKR
jgi:hypothetical protein